MRKIFSVVLALCLVGGGFALADQISAGQERGQSGYNTKFVVVRNGRSSPLSKDRVVIWDSVSADGITVTTTTTSYDGLVAGVLMDDIPGNSNDETAADSSGTSNWGRMQIYGPHTDVSMDNGMIVCSAGSKVGTSAVAGQIGRYYEKSSDDGVNTNTDMSRDYLGVTLEACATGNKSIDVFIRKG